ncbi:uncharacterized [Tachysurus ichikawai]
MIRLSKQGCNRNAAGSKKERSSGAQLNLSNQAPSVSSLNDTVTMRRDEGVLAGDNLRLCRRLVSVWRLLSLDTVASDQRLCACARRTVFSRNFTRYPTYCPPLEFKLKVALIWQDADINDFLSQTS